MLYLLQIYHWINRDMAVPVRYSIILLTSLIFAKFPQQNASVCIFSKNYLDFIDFIVIAILMQRIFTVELLEANFTSLDTKFMSSAFIILYDTKVAYLEFTLAQEVNEFIAKINVDILRKNNHRTSVMNQTMSGCKFLQNDQKSNLFKIIYKELFRVANFRKCPFLKVRLSRCI